MTFTHHVDMLARLEGAMLIYLGFLFFLNSVSYIAEVKEKEIVVGSVFLSLLILLFSFFITFGKIKDIYSIEIGGVAIFFSCLYLWRDFNLIFDAPNEGIGYFCIYFFVLGVLLIFYSAAHITKLWGAWLTASWVSWTFLLILYYFMYVKKYNMRLFFGFYSFLISIFTAWLPGLLLLTGML